MVGDILRKLIDAVVESRQGHAALGIVQIGDDPRHDMDRIDRGPAIAAGMQVAVGPRDHDLFEHEAAQHRRDGRCRGIPHAGVADEREVGPQRVAFRRDEGRERRRTRLLLPFEQDRDVAR